MNLTFVSSALAQTSADALICFLPSDKKLFATAQTRITLAFPEAVSMLASGDFKAKAATAAVVYRESKYASTRLVFAGMGEMEKCTLETVRRAAAAAAKVVTSKKCTSIAVEMPQDMPFDAAEFAEAVVEGLMLAAYKLTRYYSDKERTTNTLERITFCHTLKKTLVEIERGATYAATVCDSVLLARNLANTPNNDMYPEKLAEAAQEAGNSAGKDRLNVRILDKKKIEALKMHGLLAVNQGSKRPPVFIIMEYMAGGKNDKPIVLVGKGVTFDTGGVSIKPAAGMGEMKNDMHGAATVIATMLAVARLGLKLNIVGIVPSTENMVSASAVVPGDVIVYTNGVSVEVDNTDAEGRLILADALIYAQKYKPEACVDLATLTGACVVALGTVTSGLMGTDTNLKNRLKASGDHTHEYVCELPLYEEYEELIKGDVTDIKNAGGRYAGAITAALFLKRFVGTMPWAHLDIAGPAILAAETAYAPKGGSGVGVRLLCDMLRKWKV
jgi:leucyl aminopeptidase